MNNKQLNISLDVEADGPCPGLYSMLSFGLVCVNDLSQSFYSTLRPISENFDTAAMGVGGFTREQVMQFEDPASVMRRMLEWVQALSLIHI